MSLPTSRLRFARLCRGACLLCFLICGALTNVAHADDVATSLYIRTDSDRTTVVSPHARVGKTLDETTELDVTYAADIWTSASIDIRTSASVRPVTEQRDEIDLSLRKEFSDIKLNGAYRFSTEHDYSSHGLTLGGSYDFADNAATLDLSLHAIADTVGQSGDPKFARALTTIDTRLSFTQVIDPQTIVQGTYELAYNNGYQASPYRFVVIGGSGFGCVGALRCIPEHVPDTRTRHALAILLRRALSDDVSAGLTYRYYFDQWGLSSHTVLAELGWDVADDTLLALRYRFYTQGRVNFYRARYATMPNVGDFTTRDRELSPMGFNRIGLELEKKLDFDGGRRHLAMTLGLGGSFYSYADFVGLTASRALEVTTALVLTL